MPNVQTKASRLLTAAETFRWHVQNRNYAHAVAPAREIEELMRDFEQFARDEKYTIDRWGQRGRSA